MGMFDYVNFKMPCPKCGAEIDGFQTKDTACTMLVVEPDDAHHFYSACNSCRTQVELYRDRKPTPSRPESLTLEQVRGLGFTLSTWERP